MPFGERYIWGVTAGILRGLYEQIVSHMIRPLLQEVVIFLIPFAVYVAFSPRRARGLLHPQSWPLMRVAWLTVVALVFAIVRSRSCSPICQQRAAGIDLCSRPSSRTASSCRAMDEEVSVRSDLRPMRSGCAAARPPRFSRC